MKQILDNCAKSINCNMDFYYKLFARGTRYVNVALGKWKYRRDTLIHAWTLGDIRLKLRLNPTINELEFRITTIIRMLGEFKENQKRLEVEAAHRIILLECHSIACKFSKDSVGLGIPLGSYRPGQHFCKKCGRELLTKEQYTVEEMLFELGIELQ